MFCGSRFAALGLVLLVTSSCGFRSALDGTPLVMESASLTPGVVFQGETAELSALLRNDGAVETALVLPLLERIELAESEYALGDVVESGMLIHAPEVVPALGVAEVEAMLAVREYAPFGEGKIVLRMPDQEDGVSVPLTVRRAATLQVTSMGFSEGSSAYVCLPANGTVATDTVIAVGTKNLGESGALIAEPTLSAVQGTTPDAGIDVLVESAPDEIGPGSSGAFLFRVRTTSAAQSGDHSLALGALVTDATTGHARELEESAVELVLDVVRPPTASVSSLTDDVATMTPAASANVTVTFSNEGDDATTLSAVELSTWIGETQTTGEYTISRVADPALPFVLGPNATVTFEFDVTLTSAGPTVGETRLRARAVGDGGEACGGTLNQLSPEAPPVAWIADAS